MNYCKLKKALKYYSESTCVNVLLLDKNGEILEEQEAGGRCLFCEKMKDILPNCPDCTRVLKYGSMEAQRFGGKYIFFCPMGLTLWAAPVLKDDNLEYTAVGGPVLMVDIDEFIGIDLASKVKITEQSRKRIKRLIKHIKKVEPGRVTALSEQLFFTASYFYEGDNRDFNFDSDMQENRAKVSEYIHYIKSMNDDYQKSYPIEKERELLEYISQGDKESAQSLLNEILGYILFKTGNDFETIRARTLELIVLLSRAAIEGGGDSELIFGWNYNYIKKINEISTADDLIDQLNIILKKFSETVFESDDIKHIDTIYKSIRYIKANYMKKITLENVADYVHFSPSYFSKIFKEETGAAFNSYLNKIRVENSKKLLLDNDLSIIDIANMAGFEDQSYYTKVFKKITGKSPGKYRETRGKRD